MGRCRRAAPLLPVFPALAGLLAGCVLTTSASASPPNVPSVATAREELAALTVAPESAMVGYSREEFPHWRSIDGCTARETVLRRDGVDVEVDEECYPVSGTWHSPYDGDTLSAPEEVEIDHVVPLAEAWRSGAQEWSAQQREDFANDLDYPELVATSSSSNRSKGDQDPADWLPVESYVCTYARMWVRAKYHWELTVDEEEQAVLRDVLDAC